MNRLLYKECEMNRISYSIISCFAAVLCSSFGLVTDANAQQSTTFDKVAKISETISSAVAPTISQVTTQTDSLPSLSQFQAKVTDIASSSATTQKKEPDDSNRLFEILGAELYNIPVNITTPPGTPLDDVLRILAERAQLNFIAGEGVVKGNVGHLRLRDVPLGVALNSLLTANGLYLLKDGANVLRIVPRDTVLGGATYELKTQSVRLNWIPADSLKDIVGQISKTAVVQVHSGSNTIFVSDAPANIDNLVAVIRQLDAPQKQVQVNSYVVEVINENSIDKGANLTISSYERDGYVSPDRFFQVLQGAGTYSGGGVVSIFGSEFDIRAALRWAEEQRVANLLTEPSIVALDNEEATIDIVKKIPYFEAQQGVGGSGTVANTVQFEESGIKLTVTPQITNDGHVRLKLAPEQKVKAGEVYTPGSTDSIVPIIDTRKAATTVIVRDRETVVIGGLSQLQDDKTDNGVPWLRKAPLFGRFFAAGSKGLSKNNLVIFVRPQIIHSTGIPPTQSKAPQAIEENSDLPDYFSDDSLFNRLQQTRDEH